MMNCKRKESNEVDICLSVLYFHHISYIYKLGIFHFINNIIQFTARDLTNGRLVYIYVGSHIYISKNFATTFC